MTNTGWCEICVPRHPVLTGDLVSHIAVHHADVYEPFETWPDGAVVVIDATLEPHEFEDQP